MKKRGLCIDLCLHFLIFSIYNMVLVVEAVLPQLNSMPTYVILFGSERELRECLLDLLSPSSSLSRNKVNDQLNSFLCHLLQLLDSLMLIDGWYTHCRSRQNMSLLKSCCVLFYLSLSSATTAHSLLFCIVPCHLLIQCNFLLFLYFYSFRDQQLGRSC